MDSLSDPHSRADAAGAPRDDAAAAFSAAPRPFRPTALHIGTVAVHVGAAATVIAAPPLWPWAAAAVLANHLFNGALTFDADGQLLGPALTRLPPALAARGAIALTFDDGPDPEQTPWVLDQLDRAGARATFFLIGAQVAREPRLAREIVARGHAVENHSYAHAPLSGFWGPRRWRRDLSAAQAAIEDATGVTPLFFRPPFGVRTPLIEPALAACGLHNVMWSARAFDTVVRDPLRVANSLARQLTPGAIALLHDGVAVRRRRGASVLREALPRLLDAIRDASLHSICLRSLPGAAPAGVRAVADLRPAVPA